MFDLHSHILFGVDDGSRSFEESKLMLRQAKAKGLDHIVCTPHCRFDSWDSELIDQNFTVLKQYAQSQGVQMSLGYEVYWKKLMQLGFERAPELVIEGTNMLLLELSTEAMPTNWQRFIYEIQGMGLQVIIAHPERYLAVQRDLNIAYELKEMDCYLQLSANFCKGGMFDKRRKTAMALLREDMVDYLASDAHRPEDYDTYAKALSVCREL